MFTLIAAGDCRSSSRVVTQRSLQPKRACVIAMLTRPSRFRAKRGRCIAEKNAATIRKLLYISLNYCTYCAHRPQLHSGWHGGWHSTLVRAGAQQQLKADVVGLTSYSKLRAVLHERSGALPGRTAVPTFQARVLTRCGPVSKQRCSTLHAAADWAAVAGWRWPRHTRHSTLGCCGLTLVLCVVLLLLLQFSSC